MSPVPDPSHNHNDSPLDDFNSETHGPVLIGPGSSSEDEDTATFAEYQPLPQGPEYLDEEETIDYNSVSGLLSALNTHGPNEINFEASGETGQNDTATKQSLDNNVNQADNASSASLLQKETEKQRKEEYGHEQATLWNNQSNANQIDIDETKKEEIKSVMMKITLPNSAIPPWAKELSDEEWKNQVSSRIFGKTNSQDEER